MYDIWIDLVSPPQVNFFKPLIDNLDKKHENLITIRERNEAVELGKELGIDFIPYGKDEPVMYKKLYNIGKRILSLSRDLPDFKVGLATENPLLTAVCILRNKPSIMFFDNDRTITRYNYLIRKVFNNINRQNLVIIVPEVSKQNFYDIFDDSKVKTYPGYKEHISICDFEPDKKKIETIPFSEYIILRSEALSAAYVKEEKSIVKELIKGLSKKDFKIVYLPRKSGFKCVEESFLRSKENIFVPDKAIDGLNACYFANAVLTGSGTMGREAAVLGTTAVSFYPHDDLLSVDQDLVNKGKVLHSRNPQEIVDHVVDNWDEQREPEYDRARKIKENILKEIDEVIKAN